MPTPQFNRWFHGVASAAITGACSAGLASLGINAANVAGIVVPQLNLKQLGFVILGGGLVGMMAYLKQSPLPDDAGDNKNQKANQ